MLYQFDMVNTIDVGKTSIIYLSPFLLLWPTSFTVAIRPHGLPSLSKRFSLAHLYCLPLVCLIIKEPFVPFSKCFSRNFRHSLLLTTRVIIRNRQCVLNGSSMDRIGRAAHIDNNRLITLNVGVIGNRNSNIGSGIACRDSQRTGRN